MGQSSLEHVYTDQLVFKVGQIRSIPQTPAYTTQNERLTPCIWLPLREEAMKLVNYYIAKLNYIQHVTHHRSLSTIVEEVYHRVEGCKPVQPGKVILLLSIITYAMNVWVMPHGLNEERPLFLSSSQASSQTPIWIKAT
ncbi:hypothetical protein G6011_06501 [Alternaria panax]|uniref:Uncharacterized protein n=1 Tax=Alternaria panax TaxID=48097 RepID=A0AAD4FIK2_9PLEO|nr:hypothetical protein G6011_06501 [Alternaria panax]